VTIPTPRPGDPSGSVVVDQGDDDRAVYTVDEVAYLLTLSRSAAYAMVRAGEIPARRLGRRWVIPKNRFHVWLDDLPEASLEDVARECGIGPDDDHQVTNLDPADLVRARDEIDALDRGDLHLDDIDPRDTP
jgi:excisionase family DNA binding protein